MALVAAYDYIIEVPALRFLGDEGDATIDFGAEPLELGESFTLEVWFRPNKLPQGGLSILATNLAETAAGGTDNISLCLWLDSGIPTLSVAGDGQIRETAQVAPALQQEKSWCHIAVVCDQGALKTVLYRSGAKASETRSLSIRASDGGALVLQKLVLASFVEQGLTTVSFSGAFAELRLWNSARSEGDISGYRLQRLTGDEPSLQGYWMLDETDGVWIYDSSSQDNDAMVHSGRWESHAGLDLIIDSFSRRGARPVEAQAAYLKTTKLPNWEAKASKDIEPARRLADRRLADLQGQLQEEQDTWKQKHALLSAEIADAQRKLQSRTSETRKIKAEELAKLEAMRKVTLADFIERLQDEVAMSKIKIAKDHGSVYGLDEVVLDVKMVPGYGGVGLQLPEPGMKTEAGRLSTLTVRLRARRTEVQPDRTDRPLVEIPQLEGTTEVFARRRLGEAGFRTAVVYEGVDDVAMHGRVIRQLYSETKPGYAVLDSIVTLVIGQSVL